MSIENIHKLLEKIQKCDVNSGINSENTYNIFEVMGVEYNEVIVCRFIGNLLDPKGRHGLGDKPLRLFIRDVLKDNSLNENLENAMIVLEEHTNNDRRVDIVIHLQEKVYPIEVKIWAGDQDKQLEDYYRHFFDESERDKIYYLTPDGRQPSKESVGKLPEKQISCISFSEDIKKWLKKICENSPGNVKFVIENFMEVIKKMNEKSTELQNILNVLQLNNGEGNDDYIKSAITLLKYHDEIWDKIRKNYIRGIISPGEYKIEDCDKKDTTTGISHILMCVKKKDETETKAWICVDTNLYIVAKKNQVKCADDWTKYNNDSEYNNDYLWRHIKESKTDKPIQLRHPTEELPEFTVYLEDILQ